MSVRRIRASLPALAPVLVLLSCLLVVGSATAGAAAGLPDRSGADGDGAATADTLERLASRATRAVVLIEARTPSGSSQGSGFVVDSTGRILTNHHVVANARSIEVKVASGDVYDRVSILAVDERRDIAVLQIPGFDLPALPLGNSDSVRVGSEVIAIGSPLGLENTVSTGIVSGRRQEPEGYSVLQISAPTSQGSSGGPVMSRHGEVIGIAVSQMRGGQNLNFAIPINYARGLLSHLGGDPVAVLAPPRSDRRSAGRETTAGAEPVNRSLRFDLSGFGGFHIEMEGRVGEERRRKTRITYRRIEAVGDREARIERYLESETTQRRGTFGTPQIVRRRRSRTIVSADDLRPVSAQGEVARWTGGEWRQEEYRLRFDGYMVRGSRTDTTGRVEQIERELPSGVVLRGMRNLAFASLAADSLLGRSVEFVTYDPLAGELASDRYDVRDTTTVRVAGREHEALEVNVATGLTNSTSYFRRERPRVLLRTESGPRALVEEVTELELYAPPEPSGPGNGGAPGPGPGRAAAPARDGTARKRPARPVPRGLGKSFRPRRRADGKLSAIRAPKRRPSSPRGSHLTYLMEVRLLHTKGGGATVAPTLSPSRRRPRRAPPGRGRRRHGNVGCRRGVRSTRNLYEVTTMLTRMKQAIPAALALALSFALAPQAADAQERSQECSVEVRPQQVQSGQPAVSVTARLSSAIGEVKGVKSKQGGLALATPEDLQRTEMARTTGQEAPQPVKMSRTGNQATVWLNTENAETGTHEFSLTGQNGECSGQIQVVGAEKRSGGEGGR